LTKKNFNAALDFKASDLNTVTTSDIPEGEPQTPFLPIRIHYRRSAQALITLASVN
jgi:hypothetical protein